jgi:hypothetical protein
MQWRVAVRTLALVALAAALVAQVGSRHATGYDSIQARRLKANLTFLSSDALEGRMSLQRGSEVAIQWIASQFAADGLKPANGESYLQPVPLIEYQMDRERTTLTIRRGDQVETLHAPDATGAFPNDVSVGGPIVFAGYGITAPELNYDDYAAIDAHGKVVLIFNHEPQENSADSVFNGRGNTRYANNTYKILNAQRHGAIAVLATADPNHAAPLRRTTAATARIAPEALADGHTRIPLFTISSAVAGRLFEAVGKKPFDVQAAIDAKLTPQPFEIPGATAELHPVPMQRREANSYNVAGTIEGSDPALRDETIIFSGHFDHNGTAPAGVYHGADDNGSGTVGVVELARAFAMNPEKPKRSLLFIVYAAEERGLLGSYYYASHPLRPIESTRAVINFDMIGRNEAPVNPENPQPDISSDTSNELGLIGTDYSPEYRAAVERANRTVGLKLNYKWDLDSTQQVLFRSDHYPFLLRDVPAVWWFTGFHPDYHQVTDTVEKINFEKMTRILRLAYLAGFEMADAPRPPKLEPRAKAAAE